MSSRSSSYLPPGVGPLAAVIRTGKRGACVLRAVLRPGEHQAARLGQWLNPGKLCDPAPDGETGVHSRSLIPISRVSLNGLDARMLGVAPRYHCL